MRRRAGREALQYDRCRVHEAARRRQRDGGLAAALAWCAAPIGAVLSLQGFSLALVRRVPLLPAALCAALAVAGAALVKHTRDAASGGRNKPSASP